MAQGRFQGPSEEASSHTEKMRDYRDTQREMTQKLDEIRDSMKNSPEPKPTKS